jgi:acyl dehydratase
VADKIKMPVEGSHIMMFARSLLDENPIYSDADYAAKSETGNVIAPPTFGRSVAQFDPNYHLRLKSGEKWFGSGKNPTGLDGPSPSTGGLHAEQHYEYHRHLKPGDQLTVTQHPGKTWEKKSKRAGLLKFTETVHEFRDQDDELVLTMRSVGVKTEKPVEQS